MSASMAHRLRRAADELDPGPASVLTLLHAHGMQVREVLFVFLGVLCLCPLPGVGTVVGLAILAVALAGLKDDGGLQLPTRLGGFSLSHERAQRILRTLARCHAKAERISRPRLQKLADGVPSMLVAGTVAWLGMLVALPIPLGNQLPGLALILTGLGLLRRDGLVLLLAAGFAVLATAWPLALAAAAWWSWDGMWAWVGRA